ncbi:glutathione S-transferase family protein [Rhizobium sp. CSW-27]|uniref:glutathione S-transferase family protein n=1 Tax=Rhizobium sp. CSW-27 TaxID=2839985 RepID=UPI001C027580|nr:glutathione S-transferase family protein [Rhizobium sp. CSW-27]MBT9368395.1 glutathione S-transferase family protein [Rhizobium sp. CSW-27]
MYMLYATRGSGNCFKPFLTLCQLDIAFSVLEVDVLKGETRGEAFRRINPAGAVPYLVTEEGVGIGESNAMLWLIAEGSHLMPGSALDRARSLQWMFFEQSKLEPNISPARFLGHIAPHLGRGREAEIAAWQDKARAGLATLDAHLAGHDYMLGDRYGITDIALYGYVHVGDEAGIDLQAFPSVCTWMERVRQQPGHVPLSALCASATPFSSGCAA